MVNNLQGELLLMDSMGIKPNYAQLAKKYGMDWRTVKKYHEGYKGKPITRDKPSKLDAYKCEITDKLTIRRITVKGVYEFMVDRYGLQAIGSYSNFMIYVNKYELLPKVKTLGHPRYETPIGKQGQVDWKEDIKLESITGVIFIINVLHLTLSFSRYSHLELSIQRRTDDVYRCLIRCFEAFGGVPEEILFDNMSTIANINKGKKTITTGINKFARDFGFKVRLCGTRKPETKGSVEAKNKVIDWIRAYNKEFSTIDELVDILHRINSKMNISYYFYCNIDYLPANSRRIATACNDIVCNIFTERFHEKVAYNNQKVICPVHSEIGKGQVFTYHELLISYAPVVLWTGFFLEI